MDAHWQAIHEHARRLHGQSLQGLIAAHPARAADFSLRVGPLYANFARQHYDREALAALFGLARSRRVQEALRAMFAGEPVNASEARPALHVALRAAMHPGGVASLPLDSPVSTRAIHAADAARARMAALCEQLRQSDVADVVNVGIGGSDLGPRLAVDALQDHASGRFRLHFLNNADAHPVQRLIRELDPARTAVILVSKSFGTQETLLNGRLLRDWLGRDEALFAVTANTGMAEAFGVAPGRVLPMWDWVGGRYSLWSAAGFSLALAIGMEAFEAMLAGAAGMDAHVLEAAPEANMALWHALTAIWNRNGLGHGTQAVMPYDERLSLLPAYLQQLVMESLGKSVGADGAELGMATTAMLWGGTGTSSQHSFFQALHQGTDIVPSDFVGVREPHHAYPEHHRVQLANLHAQMEALANGADSEDPRRRHPGGRPSTLFMLDSLTPHSLGALLAMYEHSTYLQSVLWGINAFDQWGVELGKRLAEGLLPALEDPDVPVADPVTRELIARLQERGQSSRPR